MVALPKREMCFWPAKTTKKSDFFEMHTSLGPGAQKLLWHKWGRWIDLPLIFALLVKMVESFVGLSLFHLWVTFQVEVFAYCNLGETFENGFQNWFDHDCVIFGVFCCNMHRFVDFISAWTEICMNRSVVVLFWRHQSFSIVSLRGILVCFLKMLVLFSHRIL